MVNEFIRIGSMDGTPDLSDSDPFASLAALRRAFAAGLERLLHDEALGAYILVLANACFDEAVFASLAEPLKHRFAEHAEGCRSALAEGRELTDPQDDQMVFLKLMVLGLERIGVTRFRQAGPWELQFNPLRAFRPRRMSARAAPGIHQPFDPEGFHFNHPGLRRETFWSGARLGHRLDILYNKFPFVDLHGLLVPDREDCHPQLLSRRYHELVWELTEELGARLPGLGFGYNGYGANASVNHLHFQMFLRERPLPVDDPRWRHNGGGEPYPAPCERIMDRDRAWERIEDLHRAGVTYNLVYLPGRLLCLPRARQGNYRHATWIAGHAWYEMAGGVIAFNHSDFERLREKAVAAELRRVGAAAPQGRQGPFASRI